ncbi:MAG: UvrD-helicase domain-containing protein [Micromonosporaceae bacterium]
MPTDAATLAAARRAYVIAAAGFGKTHLIADAVACTPGERQLILTHTHAGVAALRRHLAARGISDRRAHVETISGFALRYATSYPRTCEVDMPNPAGAQWRHVQSGAARFLATRAGREVIGDSYGGLYVDEYQDCTEAQHALVRTLADVLPTRLLGDPMQGIFAFASEALVDLDNFDEDFDRLDDLTTPWRWRATKPALGEWLHSTRHRLIAGRDPDFAAGPVSVGSVGDTRHGVCTPGQIAACSAFAGIDQVVAIRRLPHAAHETAKNLRGLFTSMEEMDCQDLFTAARALDAAGQASTKALALLEFANKCMTRVGTHLRTARTAIERGRIPVTRGGRAAAAIEALTAAASDATAGNLLAALQQMRRLPDVVLYRAELYEEVCRTLQLVRRKQATTFADAAWTARDRTRRRGRPAEPRVVSRTLLVKGLEFEHAVVLNFAELATPKEKYVALTRPRRTLTVLR